MVRIAPSILSADFMRLGEEIRAAESAGVDMLHLDIMDGHFVPNITIGPFVVEAIRKITGLPLDVHLMIEDPDRYIKDFIAAGCDFLTVHLESCVHLHRSVHWIKDSGVKAGVSINPATPIWSLDNIISDVDNVLIMSVNPGFGGQSFIPQALGKIRMLKGMVMERGLSVYIEVDGGIKYENAKDVADAGAEILVMGSAFFNAQDYRILTSKLRERLNGK
ncbi:MAG TPA: ribulose-phosphate 3-epimerase [Nitrospiraceae bacterium]|jgi:ribulose-phosphate 3-epimerase|nr:ribulose-phosphate 3-epimerase [Nitrospiraceae bacterium]